MYLKDLQKNWNTFGREDPLWAVCAVPEKKNNRWDIQEFFDTGVKQIAQLVQWMDGHDLPRRRETALDFGCGVGRLTQALCDHFAWGVGVDIAPSMIKKAKEFNRHGKNCTYRLNEDDTLGLFLKDSFDLVYTEHVLQHIRPQVALRYISEFIRILRPGGLACFHCPSQRPTYAYPEGGIACSLSTTTESLIMDHGDCVEIPVTVTNTGGHPLGFDQQVNAPAKILHHWLDLKTNTLMSNHGYLNLPAGVIQPGGTLEMQYKTASPPTPGKYVLIMTPTDYFNNEISEEPVGIAVLVRAGTKAPTAEAVSAERPHSESHVLPVALVEQAVTAAGGRLLDIKTKQNTPGGLCTTYYYATC